MQVNIPAHSERGSGKEQTMSIPKLLALIGLSCAVAGCAKQKIENQVVNDTPEVRAAVGQDLVILLPSNPTTGYSWRLAESRPDMIKLAGREYRTRQQSQDIVGAGGVEEWRFTALGRGKTTLVFEYVRPWEKDAPPAGRKTFKIDIR